ncbi:hypothetical protein [Escherichia coli]|uniref:hypothetical protein n=1 Tax=Escherichia coli TaxID=562 RepID=UPI0004AC2C94|nr:hypothetical protein [Escherichia coli]KEP80452.1 hypothetical protein AU08_0223575 [Escherichia coli E1140]
MAIYKYLIESILKYRNIYLMAGGGILILFYITFSKIDIVSPGQGVITGENDKVIIKSPNSGFINNFNLHEGDQIEKGMILFSYTNLDYTYKGLTLKDIIAFNNKKIKILTQDYSLLENLLNNPDKLSERDVPNPDFAALSYFSFKEEYLSLLTEEYNFQEKDN